MIKLIKIFLKNISVIPNGGTTLGDFCLFNFNTYSERFFPLYANIQSNFYKNKIILNNWRLKKNDKKNVNRCNSFRTDQSRYNRK